MCPVKPYLTASLNAGVTAATSQNMQRPSCCAHSQCCAPQAACTLCWSQCRHGHPSSWRTSPAAPASTGEALAAAHVSLPPGAVHVACSQEAAGTGWSAGRQCSKLLCRANGVPQPLALLCCSCQLQAPVLLQSQHKLLAPSLCCGAGKRASQSCQVWTCHPGPLPALPGAWSKMHPRHARCSLLHTSLLRAAVCRQLNHFVCPYSWLPRALQGGLSIG